MEQRPGLDRLRRVAWWSTVGVVCAAGAFVLVAVVVTEPLGVPTIGVLTGVVAAVVPSALLLHHRLADTAADEGTGEELPVQLLAIAVAGAVVVAVAAQWTEGGSSAWGLVPGLVAGGIAARMTGRRRITAVLTVAAAAGVAAAAARTVATGDPELARQLGEGLLAAGIGGALVGGLWTWEVTARLDRARRLEARLAIADERLRFAADLHDVQGHHLQVIARFSELAARLAETDPPAAGDHMRAVEEHARTALEETRTLVQGYRRMPLRAELTNATRVLAAAGTDGRLAPGTRDAADAVAEPGRGLLGLVVREATTNVLRHSRAEEATLALAVDDGWARLRIVNDGAGSGSEETSGSGLASLARRVGVTGGSLDWSHDAGRFTVIARVPAEEAAP